jgi:hypothetical protein
MLEEIKKTIMNGLPWVMMDGVSKKFYPTLNDQKII